jgi:hypothetical protein
MVLYLQKKERDKTGAWLFWVTPNPQIPGMVVVRHPDATWTCCCAGWPNGFLWSPQGSVQGAGSAVSGNLVVPCDHIHFAYMHYIEVMAKQSAMKSKVAETVQRVRSLKAVQDNIKLELPAATFINDRKRKIKLEE